MSKPYIGLGIDPSLTNTGLVAVTADEKVVIDKGLKSKKLGATPKDEVTRLVSLSSLIEIQVAKAANEGQRPVVAMEGLAFMARNTTALVQLAGLNYMLRHRLMITRGMTMVIVAPTSLKKFITDRGNSKKDEIMMHVFKRWGYLSESSDTADAYGLARIALALSSESEKGLTKPQKEVIELLRKQT